MSLESLLTLLKGEADEAVRIDSIKVLSQVAHPEDPHVLEALRTAAADPSPTVAFQARKALDQMSRRAPDTGPATEVALEGVVLDVPLGPVRDSPAALPETADAAPRPPVDLTKLGRLLSEDAGRDVRLRALTLLIERRVTASLPLLLEHLAVERDPFVLSKLVLAVGQLGDAGILARLAPFLKSADPRVRANAAEGVGSIAHEESFRLLLPLLEDPDNRVRANVVRALKGFRDFDPMKVLGEMIASPEVGYRASALYVLSRMTSPAALLLVCSLLADPDPDVAVRALQALEERGHMAGTELIGRLEALAALTPAIKERVLAILDGLDLRATGAMAEAACALRGRLASPATPAATETTPADEVETAPLTQWVETEFDALEPGALTARLDEVERGAAESAQATLLQAQRSRNPRARLEAKARLTRLRRSIEARETGRIRRKAFVRQLAAGALLVGVLLAAVALLVRVAWIRRVAPSRAPSVGPVSSTGPVPAVITSPVASAASPAATPSASAVLPPAPAPSAAGAVKAPTPVASPSPVVVISIEELTDPVDIVSMAVSPGGDRVALVVATTTLVEGPRSGTASGPPPTIEVRRQDIHELDMASRRLTPLTSTGAAASPCYLPDGRLLYVEGVQGMGDLVLIERLRGRRRLTTGILASHPSPSPTGRTIAVQVNAGTSHLDVKGSDVALIELGASEPATLQNLAAGAGGRYLTTRGRTGRPTFAQDARHLAFLESGPNPGTTSIRVVDVRARTVRSGTVAGEVTDLGFARGGGTIVYRWVDADRTSIVQAATHELGRAHRPIVEGKPSRPVRGLAIDPAGDRIITVEKESGFDVGYLADAGDLWLHDLDGHAPSRLTSEGTAHSPAFSGGSDVLVFLRRVTGRSIVARAKIGAPDRRRTSVPAPTPSPGAPRSTASGRP